MDQQQNLCDNDTQHSLPRWSTLALTVAVVVLVYVPMYLSLFLGRGLIIGPVITLALMAAVPFVVARLVPKAASFDSCWLPRRLLEWLWFPGLVLALFACYPIAALLVRLFWTGRNTTLQFFTTGDVILAGVILILLCPIAEEIFWRGYFLEQLRKLTWSWLAVITQSLLFALAHFHGFFGPYASIQAFYLGIVLGTWRVRLRSILPLILAHMIFNAVATIPLLKWPYQFAQDMKELPDDLAKQLAKHFEKTHSDPKCRQIAALAQRPSQEAVPAIIEYFADPDEDVRWYAMSVIGGCFRREAEPFLRKALASRDKSVVDTALSLVGTERYYRLKQEVRDIAWSGDFDPAIQASAVLALFELKDEEGLRRIVESHPSMKLRAFAEHRLKDLSH